MIGMEDFYMGAFSKRSLSCVLSAAVVLSSVTLSGCGPFKKQSVDEELSKIKGNTPWYDLQKTIVSDNYADPAFEELDTEFIGAVGDNVAFRVQQTSGVPTDIDPLTADLSNYRSDHLDIYSRSGELVDSIDISETFDDALEVYGVNDLYYFYNTLSIAGDKLIMQVEPMPSELTNYTYAPVEITYDMTTGEVEDHGVIECDPGFSANSSDFFSFGDTVIEARSLLGASLYEGSDLEFCVTKNGVDQGSVSLLQSSGVSSYTRVGSAVRLSDDEILFIVDDFFSDEPGSYVLNLDSMSITDYTEDLSWIGEPKELDNMTYIEGAGNLVCDRYGIKLIDLDSKTADYVFRFDYCNINRFDASELELIDYSEDHILFAGDVRISEQEIGGYHVRSEIFDLTKADTNPHAGKDVIRVAVPGEFNYASAEACCVYNEGDNSCYAILDERYIIDGSVTDPDEYLAAMSDVENRLRIDMMAGDGPDIIMNAMSFMQLDSPDLLVDLSSAVPTGNYFTNVFDACKIDGVLYQMPLTCGVAGISTERSSVTSGNVGMTYDEYLTFVNGVCNGDDPIDKSRLDVICMCVDDMSDIFSQGGEISFDNDEFRELAGFINDNINDPVVIEYSDPIAQWEADTTAEFESHPAYYTEITSYEQYLRDYRYSDQDPVILGLPSCDSRGPALVVNDSVAISAKSENIDGCRQFINVLLSDDIQMLYAVSDRTPVNIDAFESAAQESQEAFNRSMSVMLDEYSSAELAANGMSTVMLDEQDIADYEALIMSCDHMPHTDSAVMLIVREEIQAYFAGQKTLEEVLEIINNRVATFVNERG